jgi:hypothetical protein
VAIQAPAHVHLNHRSGNYHITHIAMASLTVLPSIQVRLMAEKNEIRLFADAGPRDWLAALPRAGYNLDSRQVSRNGGMAAHAFFHGGYPGNV